MKKRNKVIRPVILSFVIYLILPCFPAFGGEGPEEAKAISSGMDLPQFVLDAPGSTDEREYLGVTESRPFSVSQISAKIIVLELFSIYCPHCRKQAAVLNKIYEFIKQDPQLSNGIKMVGIAAGARKSETDGWKTSLNVPFPLFPDQETTIWQKLGKPGVPCTLIVTSTGKVLATHLGATEDIEVFFREIRQYYNEHK